MTTKQLNLTFTSCGRCPYSREGTHKGLPNGYYHCRKVYDDRPNFQGSYRSLGSQYDYYKQIPEWCPLPDETMSELSNTNDNRTDYAKERGLSDTPQQAKARFFRQLRHMKAMLNDIERNAQNGKLDTTDLTVLAESVVDLAEVGQCCEWDVVGDSASAVGEYIKQRYS